MPCRAVPCRAVAVPWFVRGAVPLCKQAGEAVAAGVWYTSIIIELSMGVQVQVQV